MGNEGANTFVVAGIVALIVASGIGRIAASIGFPIPNQARRLGCVDGLRGYLALFVMVYHFALWSLSTRNGEPWQRPESGLLDSLGPGSVNLFFMVTGFVFYPQILVGFKDTSWNAVYISRVFRILPLVAVSIILIAVTILIRLDFSPASSWSTTAFAALAWLTSWDQPPLFGYADSASLNAGVFWSLRYEWLFYIVVLPIAAMAMDFVRRIGALTATVPVIILIMGLIIPKIYGVPTLFNYLPMFACGMLGYEIAQTRLRTYLASSTFSAPLLIIFVIGLFAGHTYGPLRFLCHAIFFVGVACGNSIFGILKNRGALVLGEGSYAIYLLHGYVLNLLFVSATGIAVAGPITASILLLPAVAIAVCLFALASFKFIELPMILLGKRLIQRTTRRVHIAMQLTPK